MIRYSFKYGYWRRATVTVYANNETQARIKACETMDKRYERAGEEPPVAWTLELISVNDMDMLEIGK